MKTWPHIPLLLTILALSAPGQTLLPRTYEAYPAAVQARLENRDRILLRDVTSPSLAKHMQFVIRITKLWDQSDRIQVGFDRGPEQLRERIALAASKWTNHADVSLVFRDDQGRFLDWSRTVPTTTCDIRITFDEDGCWSAVGTDSRLFASTNATMCFKNFDLDLKRPTNWEAVVLHEFGHALGFEHEHQSPASGCEDEFRWQDDPGYRPEADEHGMYVPNAETHARPGVYTWFAGYPNYWDMCKVDCVLRKLRFSRAFVTDELRVGPFDGQSIMKYYFDDAMFTKGTNSSCFTPEVFDLSPQDKAGARECYPPRRQAASAKDVDGLRNLREKALKELLAMPYLPEDLRTQLKSLESTNQAR